MNKCILLLVSWFLISCQTEKQWVFDKKINLPEGTRPLGLTRAVDGFWVSDPDNNRILVINENGEIEREVGNLQRPMHIEASGDMLFIPNYGIDTVSLLKEDEITVLEINENLDAPAGISVLKDMIAIADFYNHRILLIKEDTIIQVGHEGRTDGLLYYPTDVKLYEDKLIVADAYNYRVQVFDQRGNFLKVIGWQEDIQVATGLDVSDDKIFVTDYYGNRVLVYDFEGVLLEIFEDHFNKPTDVLVLDQKFYVTNYGENTISIFSRK